MASLLAIFSEMDNCREELRKLGEREEEDGSAFELAWKLYVLAYKTVQEADKTNELINKIHRLLIANHFNRALVNGQIAHISRELEA